jgi:DNA-binding CsgD family transcriptional regulator
MAAGFHLEVFDFAAAETLSEEARDLARSCDFLPSIGQTGIDLLFNFARRGDLGRVETLMPDVEAVLAQEGGWHEWLWRLRFAEARAEIALARGAWEETVQWAEKAIGRGRAMGRVKYEAAGLSCRAQALQALGRTREAISDLRRAVALARPVGDPAMLLRAAAPLLAIAPDTALAAEARRAVDLSLAVLPDGHLRHRFEAAEPVRLVLRLTAVNAAGIRDVARHDPGTDSSPRYPDGLSAREVEVLRLLAAGQSNRAIGAALVISLNTVERHINHIFAKTGAANRVEAARYAGRHGLAN